MIKIGSWSMQRKV